MLGHQLLKSLCKKFEVMVTLKGDQFAYNNSKLFNKDNSFYGINVFDNYSLLKVLLDFKPDVVLNSLGVIKYRSGAEDLTSSLEVNSLLPNRLAMFASKMNYRLINFSTDCVFSGESGMYKEEDQTDTNDIYGRTKALGEVKCESSTLTLRTSFFGLELKYYTGLVEWFLAQKGEIKGFSRAIYSGVSTLEVAKVVERILIENIGMNGLYHLSSDPIDKYTLLKSFQEFLGKDDVVIHKDDNFVIDRSLDSSKLRKEISYAPPSWNTMLSELADEVKKVKG